MIERYAPASGAPRCRRWRGERDVELALATLHFDRDERLAAERSGLMLTAAAADQRGHRRRRQLRELARAGARNITGRAANDLTGLLHAEIGGYRPADIRVVGGVGHRPAQGRARCRRGDLRQAELHGHLLPRGRADRCDGADGPLLDGVAEHMADHPQEDRTFVPADAAEPDRAAVVAALRAADVDVLMNYLPVGSQLATEFYAECALEAGVAFVNNIPVFIASDAGWAERFRAAGVPIVGDDIKAQIGATIVHRVLTDLFGKRGVVLDRTYQLNTGGNTDFLNMSNRTRLDIEEDLQDRGGAVGRRASPRRRRTSTSARPTMSPGRTTTRSASCGWKGGCSAACR